MVLNHAVNEPKVIGRPCRTDIVHMGGMIRLTCGSGAHATTVVLVVLHAWHPRHPRHLLSKGGNWHCEGGDSSK